MIQFQLKYQQVSTPKAQSKYFDKRHLWSYVHYSTSQNTQPWRTTIKYMIEYRNYVTYAQWNTLELIKKIWNSAIGYGICGTNGHNTE